MNGAFSRLPVSHSDLTFADVRADLHGQPRVLLEPLLGSHGLEAYRVRC